MSLEKKYILAVIALVAVIAVAVAVLLWDGNVSGKEEYEALSVAVVAPRPTLRPRPEEPVCRVNIHPAEMPCNELERRIASWPPVPPMAMPVEEMPVAVEWDFELLAQKALEHFKNNN